MRAKVERAEILDFLTYADRRDAIRASAMAAKDLRRVHLGDHLTLLFENQETIRYQIQEMVRAEQMVRESDIRHELDTYNAVLGGEGELGCTLLIEIPDAALRPVLLRRWRGLPGHLHLTFTDGSRESARFDAAQMDEARLSSVQFLIFPVGDRTPVGVLVDLPELAVGTPLSPATRRALLEDLGRLPAEA
ncbi:DUF3501 family protein [Geothrix sp. SG200]|uniref:DUF3501 family protein n=1 Tax=Geothrix sp. SG200 TaxID=2922865 RepID=UPI001FACE94F|nr:DUF3501 family protein [Geothrix sp. SG200]